MSYAKASVRARNALHGYGGRGNDGGVTTQDAGNGRKITVSNGSTMNMGGDDKFGLYPTVGVSVGFLNLISSCCAHATGAKPRSGVNLPKTGTSFLL